MSPCCLCISSHVIFTCSICPMFHASSISSMPLPVSMSFYVPSQSLPCPLPVSSMPCLSHVTPCVPMPLSMSPCPCMVPPYFPSDVPIPFPMRSPSRLPSPQPVWVHRKENSGYSEGNMLQQGRDKEVFFVGPLMPLFWTSGDVSPGLQSKGASLGRGLCHLHAVNSLIHH